jgi:hypothetical protein
VARSAFIRAPAAVRSARIDIEFPQLRRSRKRDAKAPLSALLTPNGSFLGPREIRLDEALEFTSEGVR